MTDRAFEKVSVIVPVAGHTGDLAALRRDVAAQLGRLGVEHEILFLAAGHRPSVDAIEGEPGVRVLRFAESVDEAAMLGVAAEQAQGDLLLTLPPRFEIDLAAIPALCEAAAGADLVIACRRRRPSGNAARRQSELFNRLISRAAGSRFRDIASGTRAIRPGVLREVPLYGDLHRYLPILAERSGFRVREIEVDQHPEAAAPAVHRPSLYLWRAIDVLSVLFIARFTRHPLRLFGGVGSAFALVGLLLLVVLAAQRLAGTPLAGRPMLVLATLLVGLGVQAFAIGLLGELIVFFHARRIRDYRVADVYEGSGPVAASLPERPLHGEDRPGSGGGARAVPLRSP